MLLSQTAQFISISAALIYGIRRSLNGLCSITEATSRPVHNWMGDRLGLPGAVYTREAQRTT